ncbi:MAG TPA: hypothetical protein VGH51_20440 [Candidatus Angelobacter sp.]|jgi:hypothetical protein
MKRLRRRDIRAEVRRRRVPTEQDWGNYPADLDQNHAYQKFSGKTNEEVQRYFKSNALATTEDLRRMPRVPFQYYMLGFRDAIAAEAFEPTWKSDAASCFLGLILEKIEKHPDHILAIMPELLPTAEHVADNQTAFGAKESVYGSFLKIFKRIQALYAALGG